MLNLKSLLLMQKDLVTEVDLVTEADLVTEVATILVANWLSLADEVVHFLTATIITMSLKVMMKN
jgi:hypothetical protein